MVQKGKKDSTTDITITDELGILSETPNLRSRKGEAISPKDAQTAKPDSSPEEAPIEDRGVARANMLLLTGSTRKIDPRKRAQAVFLVFATVFIDMLGLTLTIPILANLTRDIQGEPDSCCPGSADKCDPGNLFARESPPLQYYTSSDPDIPSSCVQGRIDNDSNIGLASSAYALGTFVSTFWMPKVSDGYGRRTAFFLSLQGSGVGFLFFAFSINFGMLLFARFFGGLFGGSVTIAQAYVTDVYEPHERAGMFARMGATVMLSVLIGPMLGASLVTLFQELRAPLYAGAVMSMVALNFAYFYIKDPQDLRVKEHFSAQSAAAEKELLAGSVTAKKKSGDDNGKVAPQEVKEGGDDGNDDDDDDARGDREALKKQHSYNPWKVPLNCAIGLQTFLTTAAFNGLTSLLALLLLESKYNVVDEDDSIAEQGVDLSLQIGFNALIISSCSIPSMIFLFNYLVKRVGVMPTGVVGSTVFGTMIFCLPYTPNLGSLMGCLPLVGLGMGLQMNVSSISLSAQAPTEHVASTLAVGTTCDALAAMVGPFLTLLTRESIYLPFMLAGACGWCGALVLVALISYTQAVAGKSETNTGLLGERSGTGGGPLVGSPDWYLAKYSAEELDRLEAQARSWPSKASKQGEAVFNNPEALVQALFPNQTPGVDYDSVFAHDLVGYFAVLYETLKAQNHVGMLHVRANVARLDELETLKAGGGQGELDYGKLRAKELHFQALRDRVKTSHNELIFRSQPYLPVHEGTPDSNPEAWANYFMAISEMMGDLGHSDFAAEIGQQASNLLHLNNLPIRA